MEPEHPPRSFPLNARQYIASTPLVCAAGTTNLAGVERGHNCANMLGPFISGVLGPAVEAQSTGIRDLPISRQHGHRKVYNIERCFQKKYFRVLGAKISFLETLEYRMSVCCETCQHLLLILTSSMRVYGVASLGHSVPSLLQSVSHSLRIFRTSANRNSPSIGAFGLSVL